ncbi:hypothetical protein CFOL_v3_28659 [Cephalotus follicularis]|uniref:MTHFR SAM-binding regulatory domain-containing protein n=1 Tax=Cephalotus follicularis TaxID=3775 RepID=A0A1Q3CYJ8_CEPFO|nr:hypothetical protein CFOL_v3_28659 [Cephalotus follicularis]
MAVNKLGTWISNVRSIDVNAVTWRDFPAKEIIQPTLVDPANFIAWKDEAFEIWSRGWANLYPKGDLRESCWKRCRAAIIWSAWLIMIISMVMFLLFSQISEINCFTQPRESFEGPLKPLILVSLSYQLQVFIGMP